MIQSALISTLLNATNAKNVLEHLANAQMPCLIKPCEADEQGQRLANKTQSMAKMHKLMHELNGV